MYDGDDICNTNPDNAHHFITPGSNEQLQPGSKSNPGAADKSFTSGPPLPSEEEYVDVAISQMESIHSAVSALRSEIKQSEDDRKETAFSDCV